MFLKRHKSDGMKIIKIEKAKLRKNALKLFFFEHDENFITFADTIARFRLKTASEV
jgi:hypothetical protein